MPNKNPKQDLVGTSEAANIAECDPRTIHRAVDKGDLVAEQKLPGLRGAYIFDRQVVLDFKKKLQK